MQPLSFRWPLYIQKLTKFYPISCCLHHYELLKLALNIADCFHLFITFDEDLNRSLLVFITEMMLRKQLPE